MPPAHLALILAAGSLQAAEPFLVAHRGASHDAPGNTLPAFEYHCWTVDDVATARRFLQLGALSITTNRPGFLRQALATG